MSQTYEITCEPPDDLEHKVQDLLAVCVSRLADKTAEITVTVKVGSDVQTATNKPTPNPESR